MPKPSDIKRYSIAEYIEEDLLKRINNKDNFVENAKVELVQDGWVVLKYSNGDVYNIKVSKSNWHS
jgi:hypothetical protein